MFISAWLINMCIYLSEF